MTTPTKNRLFCTVLLLSSLQLGFAQLSNLTYFTFGPPLTPVWNISGVYSINNLMQSSKIQPLVIVFTNIMVNEDSHGKLTGGGPIFVPVGSDTVGGDFRLSGNISGGGAKTTVKFSLHFKGNGVVAGISTICSINATYKMDVNSAGTNMIGTTTGSAHFSNLGSGSLKGSVTLSLPPGVDGGWNVTLDVIPFNTRFSGTGLVQVDNDSFPAQLSTKANGNLPNNSASAKVRLSGSGGSGGTTLTMQFIPVLGATNLAATINGKILGQKVKN
jgi:hypothetical protein